MSECMVRYKLLKKHQVYHINSRSIHHQHQVHLVNSRCNTYFLPCIKGFFITNTKSSTSILGVMRHITMIKANQAHGLGSPILMCLA
jgi:hypothetical protein